MKFSKSIVIVMLIVAAAALVNLLFYSASTHPSPSQLTWSTMQALSTQILAADKQNSDSITFVEIVTQSEMLQRLEKGRILDAWGTPLRFYSDPLDVDCKYTIQSFGRDTIGGTADDILLRGELSRRCR